MCVCVTAVCGDGLANGVGVRDSGAPASEEALTAGGLGLKARARVRTRALCSRVLYRFGVILQYARYRGIDMYASLYSGASNSALL